MTPTELKAWMATNGYTISALADELGKSRQTLHYFLRDEKPRPIPSEFVWALRGLECKNKHK